MAFPAAKSALRSPRPGTPGRGQGEGPLRSGFTLIELMVSIGLVVVLMLGINYVFKMSSDSIGMGQQVSAEIRDARAVAGILQDDARHWVKDAPVFIIRNETSGANRRDFIAFPARGHFQQQASLSGNWFSSDEAFIWVGHRWITTTTDPRNVVCRVPMLLTYDPNGFGVDQAPGDPRFPLSFLCFGNPNKDPRYSIANTSLDRLHQNIIDLRDSLGPNVSDPLINLWQRMLYRYECSMTVPRKYTRMQLASASPAFVENVSQLIIEFTGDYVRQIDDPTQGNYGDVTAIGPDGVPDFCLAQTPNGLVKKTRWYGMPRISDTTPRPNGLDYRLDVVPVSQFIALGSNGKLTGAMPFERDLTTGYTCVWTDSSPAMVRVLMKVEDPSGRIIDGPWHEFILGPQ